MNNNVVRYPFRSEAKNLEDRKKRRVPCVMSQRWLQFPKQIDRHSEADYIHLDLMTKGADENERKICQIVVALEDLVAVLGDLPVKDWDKR